MITLKHNGNKQFTHISEIKDNEGLFDGIFASVDESSHFGDFTTTFEVAKNMIAESCDLDEIETVKYLKEHYENLSNEDFELLFDATVFERYEYDSKAIQNILNINDAGKCGWELQKIRGKLARNLGFDAVEMYDEYGTSYLIPAGSNAKII